MTPDPLAGLRAYHLPAPMGWWPPAPGWWFVLLLAVAALGAALLLRRRRVARSRPAHLALTELAALRARWVADADDLAFVRALSALLRRYALARFPADDAAGLSGDDWLAYLRGKCADAPAQVREMLAGSLGRALTEAPYRSTADINAPALADAAAWLFRHGGRSFQRSRAKC
jgi:hypothetical protein